MVLQGIDISQLTYREGWQILQLARTKGQILQEKIVTIANLKDEKFFEIVDSSEDLLDDMHNQLALVFTEDQMTIFDNYIASIKTHDHHEHDHH